MREVPVEKKMNFTKNLIKKRYMGLLSESECFERIIDLLYAENQIWSLD